MKTKPVRVKVTDKKYVSLLGVEAPDRKKIIFASNWKQNVETLEIHLAGVPASGTVTLKRLDNENYLVETKIDYADSLLKITNAPGSWVLAIIFK